MMNESPAATASLIPVTPAPAIAGIGKIESATASTANTALAATQSQQQKPPKRERIVVPDRAVNGGFDTKFESDPYGMNLRGILTPEQYTDAITRINNDLRPSRATKVDTALLVTGPLMVPLAIWGVRHSAQTKKRKRLLKKSMNKFNAEYPELVMRWNRRPESCLTIERRTADHGAAPPPAVVNSITGGVSSGMKEQAMGEEDVFV